MRLAAWRVTGVSDGARRPSDACSRVVVVEVALRSTRSVLGLVFSRRVVRNSLQVSVAVGCMLNAVNQGRQLLAGRELPWLHLALNFLVPYCVSTYAAVRNECERRKATRGHG